MTFKKYLKTKLKKLILSKLGNLTNVETQELLKDITAGIARVSFSQQGEDIELNRLLEDKSDGFYIDIGAFSPKAYSNTRLFYLKNWKGINIEPNTDNYQEFINERKRDINLNIAIGNSTENLTYYKFNAPALNTFNVEHMNEWNSKIDFNVIDRVEILQYKLYVILEKYLPKNTIIDFMSVDVEGMDLEVLMTNDWNRFQPNWILVEDSIYDLSCFNDSKIYKYLVSLNYKLESICGITCIYKRLSNNLELYNA